MPPARYRLVVDALAADIRSGRLPPGTRLPTHRDLATQHGLALATASRVYAELTTLGLVSGETGRGTFVRELALPPGHGIDQPAVATDLIDLNFNAPSLTEQGELMRQALRELAGQGDVSALLRYQPNAGRPHERAAIAEHLRSRGMSVPASQVLVANGAQHGLAVTVLGLLKPGDIVAVDALTYPGFKVLAATHQLELSPLAAGDNGPDLDALEQLCSSRPVRAIYTMPTMHNPLGWISSIAWRNRLAAMARRYGFLVIEDAAYAFLAADPPPPVASLLPESTIYVSGLSKSVATGLRFGFVVAPTDLVGDLERAIRITTWNAPAVVTAIATGWLIDGTVTRMEGVKRDDAQHRNALARKILARHRIVGHPSSYFLWLALPPDVRPDQIAIDLLRRGIAVSTAEAFATTKHSPQALRLALASVDLGALQHALHTVSAVIDDHAHR